MEKVTIQLGGLSRVKGIDNSFAKLSKIFNAVQKQKASRGLTMQDRAKTTLSTKELLNKYAQMGGVLKYKNAYYTFSNGMGVLIVGKGQIIGATISDFLNIVLGK